MEKAILLVEFVGVASAAISGTMVAIEKKADAFGALFLALITALGGGIIRDTLLGNLPPVMFTSFSYIAVATLFSVIVFISACARGDSYRAHKQKLDEINNIFDALGLASFTMVGMNITIDSFGMSNPLLIIAMGMVTGIGGGMLRDVITNTMPKLLCKRIYAVASLAGALLYYLLLLMGVNKVIGSVCGMGLIVALRILATKYKWNLPHAEP